MLRRRPIPVAGWDPKVITKARGRLAELLDGVGAGPDHWTPGTDAYHLRRRLSEAEIMTLDPRWLALPAIDGA